MKLYDFQQVGAEWLADRTHAILGDQMGIGKSAQAIRAADLLDLDRVAVACPAIGRENWKRQFQLWSIFGPNTFIESYDTLASNATARRALIDFKPQVLINDEGQYLKTADSGRTLTMYGPYCAGKGLIRCAPRVWTLTGTPCPNDAGELWPHFRSQWPEQIMHEGQRPKSYTEFIDRYTEYVVSDYGIKILGNKNADELRAKLGGIMLRRRAADVLELPPMTWADPIFIEPDEMNYELVRLETNEEIRELRRVFEAAETDTTRELYYDEEPVYMSTVSRLTAMMKAGPVARQIDQELRDKAYNKIIIFSLHSDPIARMAAILEKHGVGIIQGGMTDRAKQREQDQFQSDPLMRVMICQQMAAYHTITLTAAQQVGFLELAWTPDINVQAAKRAHRIGSTEPVNVRSWGLVGSIDEAKTAVLSRKSKAINELLEQQ